MRALFFFYLRFFTLVDATSWRKRKKKKSFALLPLLIDCRDSKLFCAFLMPSNAIERVSTIIRHRYRYISGKAMTEAAREAGGGIHSHVVVVVIRRRKRKTRGALVFLSLFFTKPCVSFFHFRIAFLRPLLLSLFPRPLLFFSLSRK